MLRRSTHPLVYGADLPSIYDQISEDNPRTAEEFLEVFDLVVDKLCDVPGFLHARYAPASDSAPEIRMAKVGRFKNFLLFYTAGARAVKVLFVTHGSRHVAPILHRRHRD